MDIKDAAVGSSCTGNHNYMPTGNEVTRELAENKKDTLLIRSFYCTKCLDVQKRVVGVWYNFVPGKKAYDDRPF
jgi:hypothetical protein